MHFRQSFSLVPRYIKRSNRYTGKDNFSFLTLFGVPMPVKGSGVAFLFSLYEVRSSISLPDDSRSAQNMLLLNHRNFLRCCGIMCLQRQRKLVQCVPATLYLQNWATISR